MGEYFSRPLPKPTAHEQRFSAEDSKLGRPQVRLQTESKTERTFITIRDKRNGKTSYHKVYLRTKNEEVARRRLIALDGVDDPEVEEKSGDRKIGGRKIGGHHTYFLDAGNRNRYGVPILFGTAFAL
jgi:hypothetical protein